jgi:CheY-like chemotaxis protein
MATGKLRLEMQPVDLLAVTVAAIDVVTPAATGKKIAIRTSLDAESPPVLGDHARLQQVIWNLLSNAVKFTDPGGTIDVTVTGRDRSAYVSVHDTGRGISAEFLPFVFDRFRQADASSARREGGLGLGLALVREVVELHGGTVKATSPGPGKGATFSIELPAAAIPAEQPVKGVGAFDAEVPSLLSVRVLVVDDEPDAREMLVTALKRFGAQVASASSSAEAVRLLAQTPPERRPMVVVSDIGLPREDGYALIEQIRSLPPEKGGAIPAVAVTGYANPDDRERALAAGYQLHVGKPIDPHAIARAVARVIGRAIG